MDFKSINRPRKYMKYSECNEGDVLVTGRYKGMVPSNYSDNHLFEVENEEEDYVLNSAGHLNWQLESVELGSLVRVIYKGQEVLEKGPYKGKPSHQFDVQVAVEDLENNRAETKTQSTQTLSDDFQDGFVEL